MCPILNYYVIYCKNKMNAQKCRTLASYCLKSMALEQLCLSNLLQQQPGTMVGMINQSILKNLLIIDYKSVISIMLIISEDILFKHVTANNIRYGSDRKPY